MFTWIRLWGDSQLFDVFYCFDFQDRSKSHHTRTLQCIGWQNIRNIENKYQFKFEGKLYVHTPHPKIILPILRTNIMNLGVQISCPTKCKVYNSDFLGPNTESAKRQVNLFIQNRIQNSSKYCQLYRVLHIKQSDHSQNILSMWGLSVLSVVSGACK